MLEIRNQSAMQIQMRPWTLPLTNLPEELFNFFDCLFPTVNTFTNRIE